LKAKYYRGGKRIFNLWGPVAERRKQDKVREKCKPARSHTGAKERPLSCKRDQTFCPLVFVFSQGARTGLTQKPRAKGKGGIGKGSEITMGPQPKAAIDPREVRATPASCKKERAWKNALETKGGPAPASECQETKFKSWGQVFREKSLMQSGERDRWAPLGGTSGGGSKKK